VIRGITPSVDRPNGLALVKRILLQVALGAGCLRPSESPGRQGGFAQHREARHRAALGRPRPATEPAAFRHDDRVICRVILSG